MDWTGIVEGGGRERKGSSSSSVSTGMSVWPPMLKGRIIEVTIKKIAVDEQIETQETVGQSSGGHLTFMFVLSLLTPDSAQRRARAPGDDPFLSREARGKDNAGKCIQVIEKSNAVKRAEEWGCDDDTAVRLIQISPSFWDSQAPGNICPHLRTSFLRGKSDGGVPRWSNTKEEQQEGNRLYQFIFVEVPRIGTRGGCVRLSVKYDDSLK